MDTFTPVFYIEINGKRLAKDLTQHIISFAYEESEEEMDLLEIVIEDANLQYVDDPLFQEEHEITCRFGYVGNVSQMVTMVIKDIDYDFPEGDVPTITIKAYDKASGMTGADRQQVWSGTAPGLRYSDVAIAIAKRHKLTPEVTETKGRYLRIPQQNMSDAKFLKELAKNSVSAKGVGGYVFYVEGNTLHFHPRDLAKTPGHTYTYYTNRSGVLRSFKPSTNKSKTEKKASTKAVAVNPRTKSTETKTASNATQTKRDVLGPKTLPRTEVDAQSGKVTP